MIYQLLKLLGNGGKRLPRPILVIAILTIACCRQPNDLQAREEVLLSSVSEEFRNGLQVRILKSIAANLGMKLELRNTSFARRLVFMEEGRIDICVGLFRTPEREKYVFFVDPPYRTHTNRYFFVLKGKKASIQKYEDLYHLDIGTGINALYFERFDNDPNLSKVRVKKTEQRFKMLLLNRVDAVINGLMGGQAIINTLGIGRQVEIADYYYTDTRPVYVGISKKSRLAKRLSEVETVVGKMMANGEIVRIRKDYIEYIAGNQNHLGGSTEAGVEYNLQ